MTERRSVFRRDLNSLFRNENGELSGAKFGTYAAQIISGNLLLKHSAEAIANWDSLAVLFLVLIAPEFYKKLLIMRYTGGSTERTESSSSSVTTTTETK